MTPSAAAWADTVDLGLPMLGHIARLATMRVLPNRRRAVSYDFWAGRKRQPQALYARLSQDQTQVLALLAEGTLQAQVAARFPRAQTAQALLLAESRTVLGKIVISPDPSGS